MEYIFTNDPHRQYQDIGSCGAAHVHWPFAGARALAFFSAFLGIARSVVRMHNNVVCAGG